MSNSNLPNRKGPKALFTEDVFTVKDYQHLFLAGAVLGALLFVFVYGIKILDPQYIGWIYKGDNDLKQHYMGWCHFRISAWRFPIGLIDTLSYPTSVSVIYTDSIPIVAVLFKLLNSVLPMDFQYFGWVGLLSFALTGGTASVLLKRFIKNPYYCLLSSSVFVLSFPILQRMYYHTALAFQWLILLAFIIWAYDSFDNSVRKSVIIWTVMGFTCVSIHSYYLAIIGMILLADRVTYVLVNQEKIIKRLIRAALPIAGFCVAGLLALWIFGGFYGGNSAAGEGLGTFSANFDTFINPMSYGCLLPDLGVANYFQYEGCGYLGAGVIALSLFVDVMLVVNRKKLHVNRIQKMYIYVGLGLLILSFGMATLPMLSVGPVMIGQIPYPEPLYKLLSIFRSNGRFIWVGTYLLTVAVISLAAYFLKDKKKILLAALTALILIQGLDMSKMIAEKRDYYYSDHEYSTFWDREPEYRELTVGKKAFVFMYTEGDLTMETAFFAYRNRMTLNNFYFARNIDEEVRSTIKAYSDELEKGLIRDDVVYIVKQEDYDNLRDFSDAFSKADVNSCEKDGFVIFSTVGR